MSTTASRSLSLLDPDQPDFEQITRGFHIDTGTDLACVVDRVLSARYPGHLWNRPVFPVVFRNVFPVVFRNGDRCLVAVVFDGSDDNPPVVECGCHPDAVAEAVELLCNLHELGR